MEATNEDPTVILVPGHWLGAWAWDKVLEHLSADQNDADKVHAVALTLPELDSDDPDRATKTIADQAAAILEVIAKQGDRPAVLVGHSGANFPVSLVLDKHPELVKKVVWVDSGPVEDGAAFAPEFLAEERGLPLPPFDELGQQASLDGLSAEHLERFHARAVPQPGPVLRETIKLNNKARYQVPATFVCCSIASEDMRQLAQAGHPMFAEVTRLNNATFVDLPTGHWPMWSRPRELARIIAEAATLE